MYSARRSAWASTCSSENEPCFLRTARVRPIDTECSPPSPSRNLPSCTALLAAFSIAATAFAGSSPLNFTGGNVAIPSSHTFRSIA